MTGIDWKGYHNRVRIMMGKSMYTQVQPQQYLGMIGLVRVIYMGSRKGVLAGQREEYPLNCYANGTPGAPLDKTDYHSITKVTVGS